ncbi:hypothetical protein PYW07_010046 [Mythimna separata]|uniref:non-specific serine/threonine protein kinase n=1 Tax=Mythimna separata TaxID=271217 RepID=A0AAD8DQN0_MYTSE|nr:hypothetical protein PYW07_010046 [Mythimna separata]
MYIYELPFEINKELCRLLDIEDYWKELAGNWMKYSAFDVNDMEQTARRNTTSPTNHLLTRWGQLNHRVEELFILLYKMKHMPALNCLKPVVNSDFHKLLSKSRNSCSTKERKTSYENSNKKSSLKTDGNFGSIPLPVMLIEKGGVPTTSRIQNGNSPSPNYETSTDISKSSTQGGKDNEDDEILKNVSAIPRMSYEELREATGNWADRNLLGRGGFGQVFKGEWKHLPVAVKRLRDNNDRNKELIREMCLNQYRHDNILPLYGYSLGGPEACLVYQLMGGGSLEQRLRGKTHHPPLSWVQRYNIVHGVARGLQFLHTMEGTPLIHGDIKPANILLDTCLMPKIGDFGLARKGPYGDDRTHVKVSKVFGTKPYLPDEYLRARSLSPAVDVFSYGVVMLEVATALPPSDKCRPEQLLSMYIHQLFNQGIDMATLEDPVLRGTAHSNPAMCRAFIAIGLHCTKFMRHHRPSMLEVYKQLNDMDVPAINYT